MQYMCLIYDDENTWQSMPEDERNAAHGEYGTFTRVDQGRAATIVAGDALQPISTATTVRVRNGETLVTDGPFAETKEQLGGYYLIEAKDADEALEIAARIPVGTLRVDRGAAGGRLGGVSADPVAEAFREEFGRAVVDPDPRARRLRPRRGRRPGGLRGRGGALAARRRPGEPGRVDRHDRAQPRDRPDSPRADAGDEAGRARAARRARARGGGRRREHDPRRAPRADLHLLSPGARRSTRRWR